MQSSLKARLAVLASCNTAQGAWSRNEGLKSIARSFFIAGCPAVLATLHPVNEATTAHILERFYPALLAGTSKANALKKAKLDFLSQADAAFVHPKYWANMVLIGDPAPMR
jgi:CHAT domain-containing protein